MNKYRSYDRVENNFIYFTVLEGLFQHCDKRYYDLNMCRPEQYTGLKDKNGKEIYEGDIIESKYRNWIFAVSIKESTYLGIGVELYGVTATYIKPRSKKEDIFIYKSGRYDWEVIGETYTKTQNY